MANYSKIKNFDIINGTGIGVSIFLSGCDIHCKGCFNQELWDFNCGAEFTQETLDYLMELCRNEHINHLSILGGDPLHPKNQEVTYKICSTFKEIYPNKKIWLWTGYSIDMSVLYNCLNNDEPFGFVGKILYLCDYIIDQPFIEDKKDLTLKWRGSSNQRVIDVKKSINKSKVVLLVD